MTLLEFIEWSESATAEDVKKTSPEEMSLTEFIAWSESQHKPHKDEKKKEERKEERKEEKKEKEKEKEKEREKKDEDRLRTAQSVKKGDKKKGMLQLSNLWSGDKDKDKDKERRGSKSKASESRTVRKNTTIDRPFKGHSSSASDEEDGEIAQITEVLTIASFQVLSSIDVSFFS